ncbi:uncharacterized protein LOC118750084 [Rhagoletis pomonella]|uniref:uncharacterized protein LOC118750084 n=1 Tax=Rhagoletis pomonella TaxID=28610 RepID=UPI00177A9F22|nr:uncharacterized protein LOC118750084 [Rhagoletis pomonella]
MDFWFIAGGIAADKQKAATVLAALEPSVIAQLSESIFAMPSTDCYPFIKSKILEHFTDSEHRRLNRLLSEMPLGDKRPSELYSEMKRVAGNVIGEAALKGLWTKRLPEAAQAMVAASTGTAAEFTRIADTIIDTLVPYQDNVVSTSRQDEIHELRTAVAELSKSFQKLTSRLRPRNHKNGNTARSNSRSSPSSSDLFWYHKKFVKNAQNCRILCRHKQRVVQAV